MGQTSRVPSALILLGLGAFVVLTALAAAAYPGGTFCDPNAPRYEFWGNFFCDLTQPVTQRGEDNGSARVLALASFVSFSLALIPFWWALGGLLGARAGYTTRLLGLLSAVGTNVIAWFPSAFAPSVHQLAVFLAVLPGLAAALLGVHGLFAQSARPGARARALRSAAWLGTFALAFGAADAVYYVYAIAVPGCYELLPALQKVAGVCVIGWMAVIAATTARVRPEV